MNGLTDEQLLLLSTVIYLDGVAVKSKKNLGKIVEELLEGKLENSRRENQKKEWVYPCEMSEDEWRAVLEKINNDIALNINITMWCMNIDRI